MNELAISVKNISKIYTLHKKHENLQIASGLNNIFKKNKSKFESFYALKNISFDVKKGESLGIIGRNGAGKSTLLKILNEVVEPTEGKIEIQGSIASVLEVGTGFHPELTGRENIYLSGALHGLKKKEINKYFDEIVDYSGIERFIDTPVKHYSSGMYVRLAFSVISNIDADISRIVPQLEVLSERVDKDHKTLEISATATVDVGLIETIIKSGMAANGIVAAAAKERVPMVFVFMARKITSITTSDGKKVSFQKNAKQNSESEKTTAGSKGVDVDYNMEDVTIKEYGGKSIDKAQVVEWTADTVSSVDTAINEIFTQAGYETTDAVDVEGLNVKKFREDYGVGDDVKPETRQEANKLLRSQEVGYFASGHMDVCLPSKHEVSGLPQVFVKVEAKITDLRGKFPKTVAAVAGEYYQGCGENVQVATQNALLVAARQAAAKLVDQLRAKSL